MRYFIKSLLLGFLILPNSILASGVKSNPILTWTFENILFVMAALVTFGVLFSLWGLASSIMNQKIEELTGQRQTTSNNKGPSLFQKLNKKAWNLIPIEKEEEIVLDHDYDGIRELDNSLPPWWLYTFYLTIIWGIGYIYVFHMSDIGLSQKSEYELELKVAKEDKIKQLALKGDDVDETNVLFVTEAAQLEAGKSIFLASCAACHGAEGQGGIGPNMTDDYWIHGGSIVDVFKTIKYGVPEKGMIAWKAQLKPSTIQNVASYILTLKGTNPPNPKAPQGDLFEEEVDPNREAADN